MATIDKEKVNFLRGSKEDYESLVEKDNNTIYFILDTQEIYVGDKLFSTIDFNDLISIPYIPTEEEMQSIFNALLEKQPKEDGKGLSTNDFTNEFKTKLISLFNYDDSDIKSSINNLNTALEQEAEERAALGIALAEETQSREALDTALGEEIAAREALEIDLTNEINNRQAEDSKLNAVLGQEAEEREALEAALLEEIQSRETLGTALDAETAARESLGANLTSEISNRQIADSNLNANIEQVSNKLFKQDEKFRGFITLDDQEQINNYILSNEGRKNWADGEYAFAFLNDKINTGETKFYQGIYRLTNNEVIQYIPDDHATQQWVKENYATKSDLINWRQYKVVSSIEDVLEPQTNIIYLVYNENYSSIDNVYDEYIWANDRWELIGTTKIDLSDYAQKSELPTKTSELQNDSGYITADNIPSEVYIGSEEPQGNEVIWVDNSTTAENINATKAYVVEVVNLSKTRTVIDTENTIIPAFELSDNTEYRFMLELESIEFTLPENTTDDYISSLVFKSGATATTITYPDRIKWSGEDISSDKFVPAPSKIYEVLIYWNGFDYCGIVKEW